MNETHICKITIASGGVGQGHRTKRRNFSQVCNHFNLPDTLNAAGWRLFSELKEMFNSTAVQSQQAVSVNFTRKQILYFGFAEQYIMIVG